MEHHWQESLDVDDSDLHLPTLRPCKQQSFTNQTTTTAKTVAVISTATASATTTSAAATTSAADTTTAYNSQSETLDYSPLISQTLTGISLPLNLTSEHQVDQSPPQPHTIPGPAGVVQAAKLRKTRDIANHLGQDERSMATQEYIRKAVEDPEEDEDFKRNPWLSAVEFVHSDGMFDSGLIAHLGELNNCEETGKLDQVVAVIKSCNPNGLGDMMVTLKDPTGTVSGTIHHKVLTEGDYRKGICIGSVLILYKVSVVSPSRSIHYLNITKRNLVKVFYKDGGSSQKQAFNGTINAAPLSQIFYKDCGSSQKQKFQGTVNATPHSEVFYKDGRSTQKQTFNETINAAPHSDLLSQDSARGTPLLSSTFSLERGADRIVNRMKKSNPNNEQENTSYTGTTTSNKDTNLNVANDKEILKEANVIENVGPGQLKEGFANVFGWTDDQIQEILDLDYN